MIIGLLPAAGSASRMAGLPKFLLPIPEGTLFDWHTERMQAAGVSGLVLGYSDSTLRLLSKHLPPYALLYLGGHTLAHTVANAHDVTGDHRIVFGMPDTYFTDADAYRRVIDCLERGADVAVGVFMTRPDQRSKLGMCQLEWDRLVDVIDKPSETTLTYAWGILAWRPVFWQHIHAADATVGDALPRAIRAGLDVRAVRMDGAYYDCGTPEEYFKLIRDVTGGTDAPV